MKSCFGADIKLFLCQGNETLLWSRVNTAFNPGLIKPYSGADFKLLLTRGNETLLWSIDNTAFNPANETLL